MSRIVRHNADQIDEFTGYQVTLGGDHTYIHQGKGFELSGITASISAGGNWTLALTTPAHKFIHLRPTGLATTANSLEMRIAEASIVTGGSAATPRNRNRNSNKLPTVTVATGVTLTTEGTILEYHQLGGGTTGGNAQPGSSDGSAEEWVLKPSTVYTFRFQNIGGSTATFAYYSLFWYEESAGE
jgi:hypothetical protein